MLRKWQPRHHAMGATDRCTNSDEDPSYVNLISPSADADENTSSTAQQSIATLSWNATTNCYLDSTAKICQSVSEIWENASLLALYLISSTERAFFTMLAMLWASDF